MGWGRPALVAAVAIMLAVPATADLGGWVNVLRKAGTVESQGAGSNAWVRIVTNRKLGSEASVRTLSASAAELRLADSSVVGMGPSTQVRLDRFDLGRRQRDVQLQVTSGSARSRVSRFPASSRSRFQVSTPNAVLAAQGTDFLVTVINPEESASAGDGWVQAAEGGEVITQAAVFEGRIRMRNSRGQEIMLGAGETAQIVGDGPPEPNPPSFGPQQAGEQTREQGIDQVPPPGDAPASFFDYGTLFENFGAHETGLTTDTRNTSTGQTEEGGGTGAPPLVNPQAETTGTVILEIQP